MTHADMPSIEDVPFDGFLIEVHPDSEPDGLGRQMFTIFWRDPYIPPSGVRAQVYFAVLAEKTADWDAKGIEWRPWTAGDSQ